MSTQLPATAIAPVSKIVQGWHLKKTNFSSQRVSKWETESYEQNKEYIVIVIEVESVNVQQRIIKYELGEI